MVSRLLHESPAYVFLIIPILLALTIFLFVASMTPYEALSRNFILLVLFLVATFSRIIQFWEYGLEVYHLIIFAFAFNYGVVVGLVFVLLTTIGSFYSVFFIRKHYLVHTIAGPILQTIELVFFAIACGLAGTFMREYTLTHLTLVGTILAGGFGAFDHFLCNRFIGVDAGRLSAAALVGIMINYNLFMFFGKFVLELI